MRRLLSVLLFLAVTSGLFAQFTKNGYYRVRNVATSRYIYVLDNTGSINVATTSADMGAIELYKDTARKSYDPACIMYMQKYDNGQYDIKAQGTGVHDIIGYYVDVYEKSSNQYQVYAEGKYLDDNETSARDLGFLGTERTGQYRLWNVFALNQTDNYFGVKPTIALNGKYYKPYYVSFPFALLGTGMKAYYISDIHQSAAILKEVSGPVPASTPVLIECSSREPWKNKLNVGVSASGTITGNKLKGTYFYNPNRLKSANARVAFNPATMRVLTVTSDGKLVFAKDCSSLPTNGKGTFFIPANESYLTVPSSVDDTLFVMTEDEYRIFSIAQSISFPKSKIELQEGSSTTLVPNILPKTTVNKSVSWASSDEKVATVSNGLVQALKQGKTIISATTEDGSNLVATCEVTVTPVLATSLTFLQGTLTAEVGDTVRIEASIMPEKTSNKELLWISSNDNVAIVQNGIVIIKAIGSAIITATTTDGSNLSAKCYITGQPTLVRELTLQPQNATCEIGDTLALTANIFPMNATYPALTWRTSKSRVAQVSDGKVIAIAAGDAIVSATTTDGSNITAQCAVHVNPMLVKSLSLNLNELVLCEGESATLRVSYTPANATNPVVLWTSSDSETAQVTGGVVRAQKVGEATIFATTTDGSNISVECKVVVKPVLTTNIKLNKTLISAVMGYKEKLLATLSPANVTTKLVEWSSSDTTVAVVSNDGWVEIRSVGSAVIRVTTTDGTNLSAECKVTSNPILASSVKIPFDSIVMHIGDTAALQSILLPANVTSTKVAYQLTDENIAQLNENQVIASRAGTSYIIVSTTDGTNLTDTCKLIVMPALVETIVLDTLYVELLVGEKDTISAFVLPEIASDKTLEWISNDSTIASVNDGEILAKKVGQTTIVVKAKDGSSVTAECQVVVKPILAEQLILDKYQVVMCLHDTVSVSASVLPDNTTNPDLVWSTENEEIAIVEDGKLTAIGLGETIVWARTTDGSNLAVSCSVICNPILAESIQITQKSVTLQLGDSIEINAIVLPENTTYSAYTLSTDSPECIQIKGHTIYAIGVSNNAIVTAFTTDGSNLSDECMVEILPIPVEEIELNVQQIELYEGEHFTLRATVKPTNATYPNVLWTSTDEQVATIAEDGKLTALHKGNAQIVAVAEKNPEITATCDVQVMFFSSLVQAIKNGEITEIYDLLGRQVTDIRPGVAYLMNGRVVIVIE